MENCKISYIRPYGTLASETPLLAPVGEPRRPRTVQRAKTGQDGNARGVPKVARVGPSYGVRSRRGPNPPLNLVLKHCPWRLWVSENRKTVKLVKFSTLGTFRPKCLRKNCKVSKMASDSMRTTPLKHRSNVLRLMLLIWTHFG